jgi:hypothetical protein
MLKIWHGVLLLDVQTPFNSINMSVIINVHNVKRIIVWNVKHKCMTELHVNKINNWITCQKKISNLWNLWKDLSINNVRNVNFGYKKVKDAVIWHADVHISFAIIVVPNTDHATVNNNFQIIMVRMTTMEKKIKVIIMMMKIMFLIIHFNMIMKMMMTILLKLKIKDHNIAKKCKLKNEQRFSFF